jgi:dienelactone hydrolase
MQIMAENYLLDWFGLAAVETYEALLAKADEMAECMRTAVIDLKRCVDWATDRDEVDSDRIGLIGFSMGAFLAALTLGVEPRIRAGAIVLGGARPADIIANCGGKPGMAKIAVMDRLGLSWEEYYRVLEEATCANDPARFAACFDPTRILLFDALYDTCMPARSRAALWEAMGQPERYTMHYGHKSAFLAMTPLGRNFMRRKTLAFLDRVL